MPEWGPLLLRARPARNRPHTNHRDRGINTRRRRSAGMRARDEVVPHSGSDMYYLCIEIVCLRSLHISLGIHGASLSAQVGRRGSTGCTCREDKKQQHLGTCIMDPLLLISIRVRPRHLCAIEEFNDQSHRYHTAATSST